MVRRKDKQSTTQFLNVDLDVVSTSDLQPLVNAFGRKGCQDRIYCLLRRGVVTVGARKVRPTLIQISTRNPTSVPARVAAGGVERSGHGRLVRRADLSSAACAAVSA